MTTTTWWPPTVKAEGGHPAWHAPTHRRAHDQGESLTRRAPYEYTVHGLADHAPPQQPTFLRVASRSAMTLAPSPSTLQTWDVFGVPSGS